MEWERMLAGELYDPLDEGLAEARTRCQRLCQRYGQIDPGDLAARTALLRELLGRLGERSEIVAPLFCDYGVHVEIGDRTFLNANCVLLDCASIVIGDRTLIGPAVQIYGATHPLDAALRGSGRELAKPVIVGDDVWIGGAAVLCPGVSIGDRTTIGAGSVVTRSIPADVFAAGNPCRVIRRLLGG